MKKIRQQVFETNSSSTHSICIAKNAEITLPKSLHFCFGEFGWECDTLYSVSEKASYLYTGLIANGRQTDFDNIVKTLQSKGIEVTFEAPIYKTHTYEHEGQIKSYTSTKNGGYVDHGDELASLENAICGDEDKLLSYLFSDLSFIITGNDNDDSDIDINVNYEYDEFYKGN